MDDAAAVDVEEPAACAAVKMRSDVTSSSKEHWCSLSCFAKCLEFVLVVNQCILGRLIVGIECSAKAPLLEGGLEAVVKFKDVERQPRQLETKAVRRMPEASSLILEVVDGW
jgi:hypothetical protein